MECAIRAAAVEAGAMGGHTTIAEIEEIVAAHRVAAISRC